MVFLQSLDVVLPQNGCGTISKCMQLGYGKDVCMVRFPCLLAVFTACVFDVIYQTLAQVFDDVSKHREQKVGK